MKKMLFSIAAVTLLFASCKKNDDNVSRKDTLTNGKWRITAATTTISTSGVSNTTDEYATYDACEKDDVTIFRTDMHLIDDAGAVKCNSSDPQQTDSGIWALSENDTKIIFTGSGVVLTFNIDQIDGNTLKLSYSSSQTTSGITVTTTSSSTFTHVN